MTHALYELLADLEDAKIDFTLRRTRPDTVLVYLTIVGQRIEIDVFEDGHMEVSRFRGDERVLGGHELVQQIILDNASD